MEWDSEKNKSNIIKHGISFEEAKNVFNDPNSLELYDKRHSTEDEDRYICIGHTKKYLLLTVCNTDRNGKIRIISARRANAKERSLYYERLRKNYSRM